MSYTFNEKIWKSPNEILSKVYSKIGQELRRGRLKYNQQFYYSELADALFTNHFYLQEHQIHPEYFFTVKNSLSDQGFAIRFFSSKFESDDKTREIEIQKSDNYLYKRALLLKGLMRYFHLRQRKWINSTEKCQQCSIDLKRDNSQIIIDGFELEDLVDELLRVFPRNVLFSSIQFDYGDSDHVELNLQNPIVQKVFHAISSVKYHIFCLKCAGEYEKTQMMREIMDPKTSDVRIRQILRLLIKGDFIEEFQKICEIVTNGIRLPIISIELNIKLIWQELHFVAHDMFEISIILPYLEKWILYWDQREYRESWIGIGFAAILYRMDNPKYNHILFPSLFSSTLNLFEFFRTYSQYMVNSALPDALVSVSQLTTISKSQIIQSIQGLLFTKQRAIIEQILVRFSEFPSEIQSLIITNLALINSDTGFEGLESILKKYETQISPEIHQLYWKTHATLQQQSVKEQQEEQINNIAINKEKTTVKSEYELWRKKRGPSINKMRDIAGKLVNQRYRPIIEQHVQKYKDEFVTYFNKYPEPIAALDIEEWNFRMFCVLAIEIRPDLRVFVKLMAVEDIYPMEKYTPPLRSQIRSWLKSLIGSKVISHGSNEEEAAMIADSGHTQINTQNYLHRLRFTSPDYASQLNGEGLKHFENFIKFERKGCEFLKHEIPSQVFFQQVPISLDRHLSETPQRLCEICHKEQDVLLYCLEDAFSSLLIYIYCRNHAENLI